MITMANLVLVDMDGVLSDFSAAACELFDKPKPIAKHVNLPLHEAIGIPVGLLWARIEKAGRSFWENMPETDFARPLIELLRAQNIPWVIASSPTLSPASASGKMLWIHKRFGKRFRDFAITPRKELLAGPERVLIDDTHKHVNAFLAAGGKAILVPTLENGTLLEHPDPLKYIQDCLSKSSHP